jgi:peptidoglycan hydrolase-like protein with peptidoglycan-binding domain
MQIQDETFMAKFLCIIFSVFLLPACATVSEEQGSQVETQTLSTPNSETIQMETTAPTQVEQAKNELVGAVKKTPNKQEIKSMQTLLKAAGFDPGPVDGVLGAKTMSALRRLQSGCTNLKDLLEKPPSGLSARSGEMQATKVSGTDEIRLIQVRLKDAGFDVGPVDGVMGSKTKSALVRAQSGCTMAKDAPVTLENQAQVLDRMPSPIHGSEKQLQLPPPKAPTAAESVRDEASRANAAVDKSPSKEEIRFLQSQLRAAGFDPGPFDGMLGPKTKSALQQYRIVYGSAPLQKLSLGGAGLKTDY